MNIYIGNLSSEVIEEDLQQAFEFYGNVESTKIIKNWDTGESRGFGFVQMPETDEAEAAIEGLNDSELKGKNIIVSKARSREGKKRGGKGFGGDRQYRGRGGQKDGRWR